MFLIRHEASGKMSTVIASSHRAAVEELRIKKPGIVVRNEVFWVKERGTNDDWEVFRITK